VFDQRTRVFDLWTVFDRSISLLLQIVLECNLERLCSHTTWYLQWQRQTPLGEHLSCYIYISLSCIHSSLSIYYLQFICRQFQMSGQMERSESNPLEAAPTLCRAGCGFFGSSNTEGKNNLYAPKHFDAIKVFSKVQLKYFTL